MEGRAVVVGAGRVVRLVRVRAVMVRVVLVVATVVAAVARVPVDVAAGAAIAMRAPSARVSASSPS